MHHHWHTCSIFSCAFFFNLCTSRPTPGRKSYAPQPLSSPLRPPAAKGWIRFLPHLLGFFTLLLKHACVLPGTDFWLSYLCLSTEKNASFLVVNYVLVHSLEGWVRRLLLAIFFSHFGMRKEKFWLQMDGISSAKVDTVEIFLCSIVFFKNAIGCFICVLN